MANLPTTPEELEQVLLQLTNPDNAIVSLARRASTRNPRLTRATALFFVSRRARPANRATSRRAFVRPNAALTHHSPCSSFAALFVVCRCGARATRAFIAPRTPRLRELSRVLRELLCNATPHAHSHARTQGESNMMTKQMTSLKRNRTIHSRSATTC
jgi:hypothetical protein